MAPYPLLVELVGLPGAGKTAVAEDVLRALAAQGLSCATRQDFRKNGRIARVAARLAARVRRPAPAAAALRLALSVRPFDAARMRHALLASNWAFHFEDVYRNGWDRVLLDQGIVQEVWSALVSSRDWDQNAVQRLLGAIFLGAPVTPAFVYFHIEPVVALQRIRHRPSTRSRFDRMPEGRALHLLERHAGDLDRIIRLAAEVTRAPCHTVDASSSLPHACREVTEFVLSLELARSAR